MQSPPGRPAQVQATRSSISFINPQPPPLHLVHGTYKMQIAPIPVKPVVVPFISPARPFVPYPPQHPPHLHLQPLQLRPGPVFLASGESFVELSVTYLTSSPQSTTKRSSNSDVRPEEQPSTHCISRICGLTSLQLSSPHPMRYRHPTTHFFPYLRPRHWSESHLSIHRYTFRHSSRPVLLLPHIIWRHQRRFWGGDLLSN